MNIIRSFQFAFKGLFYIIKTERNFKIHCVSFLLVLLFAYYFEVTIIELCLLLLASGMVFTAEAFNTAIEILIDKIHPQHDEKVGLAKDVLAASVLISAIFSAVLAAIIFLPKIYLLLF